MDHRGDFEVLVRKTLGVAAADEIDWTAPRLICIAAHFTKFDTFAIKQMGRNIELVRYKTFGDDLLILELLTAVTVAPSGAGEIGGTSVKQVKYKTVSESLSEATTDLANLYADLETLLMNHGDEVIKKVQLYYIAFRRIKNFACVELKPQLGVLRVYLKVNPEGIQMVDGFTRDVRRVGHFGTGNLEVTIKSHADLDSAKPLIAQSYEAS